MPLYTCISIHIQKFDNHIYAGSRKVRHVKKDCKTAPLIIMLLIMLLCMVSCSKKEETDPGKNDIMPPLKQESNTDSTHGDTVHVILSRQNKFTDQLEKGYFSRAATSGPGTGQFVGIGFEFAKGACNNIDVKGLKTHRWRPDTLGCSGKLFSSDWCARLKTDHSVQYTLHFLSWSIGPEGSNQKCIGDCEKNNNQTAYIRERVK